MSGFYFQTNIFLEHLVIVFEYLEAVENKQGNSGGQGVWMGAYFQTIIVGNSTNIAIICALPSIGFYGWNSSLYYLWSYIWRLSNHIGYEIDIMF